jgi:hypothetical protein
LPPLPIIREAPLKVIRPLTDEEKKLYVVLLKIKKEKEKFIINHLHLHLSGECRPLNCHDDGKKLEEYDSKIELVDGILCQSIQMATDSEDILLIDQNWQLVEQPEEDHSIRIVISSFPFSFGFPNGISLFDPFD